MGYFNSFRKSKEERRVQDFRIWYNDENTRKMLEIFWLEIEEMETVLQKFLLGGSILSGKEITKAKLKKVRKNIRMDQGKKSDEFFLYLNEKQEEEILRILQDTFYSKEFRDAVFHQVENLRQKIDQSQTTYIEKTLHLMDLYQRVNSDIAL